MCRNTECRFGDHVKGETIIFISHGFHEELKKKIDQILPFTRDSFTGEPRSNRLEEAGRVVGLEEGEDHSRACPVLRAQEASSGSPWS